MTNEFEREIESHAGDVQATVPNRSSCLEFVRWLSDSERAESETVLEREIETNGVKNAVASVEQFFLFFLFFATFQATTMAVNFGYR